MVCAADTPVSTGLSFDPATDEWQASCALCVWSGARDAHHSLARRSLHLHLGSREHLRAVDRLSRGSAVALSPADGRPWGLIWSDEIGHGRWFCRMCHRYGPVTDQPEDAASELRAHLEAAIHTADQPVQLVPLWGILCETLESDEWRAACHLCAWWSTHPNLTGASGAMYAHLVTPGHVQVCVKRDYGPVSAAARAAVDRAIARAEGRYPDVSDWGGSPEAFEDAPHEQEPDDGS